MIMKERSLMPVYKVKYYKECEHIMEVEASSEEEAMQKYRNFDCINVYEVQGISEEVISIEKFE
ncbi:MULTISPECIES: hypothetical protein [Paenibacillus]|uniref:Ribosomal protein L15E n=1 Tax=Paenibacillus peoriae TaxID=59893 RepID=A0ABU1QID4_9BACL|nr:MULTISPECIES: hypothetical protein [Paenibacillus]MDR6779401.1 ribosomal protein L15E [Paenibacillus peoriae]